MTVSMQGGAFALLATLGLANCTMTAPEVESRASATPANLTAASSSGVARPGPASAASERAFSAYITGYSYWDNTPPGSSAISKPVIHRRAGGTGTYADPITMAVGHTITGGRQTLDYPAGTRFYLSGLRKYAIVEDVCGDGAMPQNGPCHIGRNGLPWLDIYVDGAKSARESSTACMNRLTRVHRVIQNPAPGYPVVAGALTESGCEVFNG